MAISWGSWEYGNSSAGFRVGVEVSVSTVTNASASVTITTKWYVEAMFNVNDEMTVTFGGSISGSSTQNLTTGSSGGYKLWATKTYTYNYSTYGSSPGTRTFTGSLSGVYNGATPTKSTTVTIPARPYAAPAAPTNGAVTRNSDTQNTVTWTRNATTGAPYTSVTVQRREYNGSTWGNYATIATTTSTATSYVDATTQANRGYQYQIRANNSVGSSVYVGAGTAVYNTPAAPSAVASTLNPAGTQITTSWTPNNYTHASITFEVQRSVNGGAYANVATGLANTTTSWTDTTPAAGTNRYQVRAVHLGLGSAYAEGNTISTIVAPLAPTALSPSGSARDAADAIVLSWQHNHGGDSAPQSAFQIEQSSNGGSSWTVLTTQTSTAQTYTVPGGTWANGASMLWRVRTQGIASAGYGPFSASATVPTSAKPTTNITAPGASVTTFAVTATWTYAQAQGSAQAAWEASLFKDGVLLEARSGTGASLSTTFNTVLVDGESYSITQRSQSAAGVWSVSDTQAFTMDLLPPAPVLLDGEFQSCTGTVVLALEAAPPGAGEVAAVSANIERSIDGGDWVTIATGVALPNDVLDVLPTINGRNDYRVTGVSATPSYSVNDVVTVLTADQEWVFASWGPGFGNVLRIHSNPSTSESAGRVRGAESFLGRAEPQLLVGENTSWVVSAGGDLHYDETCPNPDPCHLDSPPADWREMAMQADVVAYRDYTGRRLFGMLSDINVNDGVAGNGSLSFSVTQTYYSEQAGTVIPPDNGLDFGLGRVYDENCFVVVDGVAPEDGLLINTGPPDTTDPTGTLSAADSGTSKIVFTISSPADAGVGLHALPFRYSSDGGSTWSAWTATNPYTSGVLTPGTYSVAAEIRDASGNIAELTAPDVTVAAPLPSGDYGPIVLGFTSPYFYLPLDELAGPPINDGTATQYNTWETSATGITFGAAALGVEDTSVQSAGGANAYVRTTAATRDPANGFFPGGVTSMSWGIVIDLDSTTSANDAFYIPLLSTANSGQQHISMNRQGKLQARWGATTITEAAVNVAPTVRQLVVATMNGTTLRLYRNGTEVINAAASGGQNAGPFVIGNNAPTPGDANAWAGRFAGFFATPTVLTQAQILSLAQAAGLA